MRILRMLLMTSIILFIACDELDVLSEMLLRLLGKYDPDKTGVIKVDMYGQFLKEAFIDGVTEHEPTIVITDSIRELLGSATAEFAMKYKYTGYVGLNNFYIDLIADFATFLSKHYNKYNQLIYTFYATRTNTNYNQNNKSTYSTYSYNSKQSIHDYYL